MNSPHTHPRYSQGSTNFPKSGSHFEILGSTTMTWIKCLTQDSQSLGTIVRFFFLLERPGAWDLCIPVLYINADWCNLCTPVLYNNADWCNLCTPVLYSNADWCSLCTPMLYNNADWCNLCTPVLYDTADWCNLCTPMLYNTADWCNLCTPVLYSNTYWCNLCTPVLYNNTYWCNLCTPVLYVNADCCARQSVCLDRYCALLYSSILVFQTWTEESNFNGIIVINYFGVSIKCNFCSCWAALSCPSLCFSLLLPLTPERLLQNEIWTSSQRHSFVVSVLKNMN